MISSVLGGFVALVTTAFVVWFLAGRNSSASTSQSAATASSAGIVDSAVNEWRTLAIAGAVAIAVSAIVGRLATDALPITPSAPSAAAPAANADDLSKTYAELKAFAGSGDEIPILLDTSNLPQSRMAGTEVESILPKSANDLPDVDTMIERLAKKLETDPSDVAGWRMLGWSYLHTERAEDAVKAYERALALDPANAETKASLAQAQAALAKPSKGPSAADIAAAGEMSAEDRNSMIAGMVDNLASRLASSPKDEEGWLKLMRSRMVLGQKEAASEALALALKAFADDATARARLSNAAEALGVRAP